MHYHPAKAIVYLIIRARTQAKAGHAQQAGWKSGKSYIGNVPLERVHSTVALFSPMREGCLSKSNNIEGGYLLCVWHDILEISQQAPVQLLHSSNGLVRHKPLA